MSCEPGAASQELRGRSGQLSRHIVHVVVEVVHEGATDMTQHKRNHGHQNHLNCSRHDPMMTQARW